MNRILGRGLKLATILFWVGASGHSAEIADSFTVDPLTHGWRIEGDPSLFRWSAGEGALDVTWDSAKSNSFCYLPLGTILTKADSFQVTFAFRLRDIHLGSTPGKPAEFPIAIGLIHHQMTTNPAAYRGAGVSGLYGVKNIAEWNFFPDGGFGDTWATTVVSSNNVFAFAHTFPVPLIAGDLYRVTLMYTASSQVLRTSALRNGQAVADFESISLAGTPDFRLDAFSVTSYSDAVQSGPPVYHGSVLAHAFVDEIALSLPSTPVANLTLQVSAESREAAFLARSNWVHRLERSIDLANWQAASPAVPGQGARLVLRDTNAPVPAAFYRIRSERP